MLKRAAFAAGSLLVVAGVLLHIPAFWSARHHGFMLAGMPMGPAMRTGMVLLVAGLAAAAWGLLPYRSPYAAPTAPSGIDRRFAVLDGAAFSRAHAALVAVLTVSLVVDTMKPATLGFVLPGMRDEYGLTAGEAALLPLTAIAGTVAGSLLWGRLADVYGRRATILMSALMYVATSVCGFMPSFGWNLVMCALMGTAAGGMLPTVFALMAESVPAGGRGWLVVAQSGVSAALGYLAASGTAALLVPQLGWRSLWLLGMPTGLVLLVLRRWIPESPRFLLVSGRHEEATRVMARYGMGAGGEANGTGSRAAAGPTAGAGTGVRTSPATGTGVRDAASPAPPGARHPSSRATVLLSAAYRRQTAVIVAYGLSWGLVNWGFITYLPSFLAAGGTGARSNTLLFLSSLLAMPATAVAAALYARWSSRKTMLGYAAATAAGLLGFALLHPERPGHGTALVVLTALLMSAAGGMVALLAPYATEVYPTALRATGSGVAAAGSKAGGLFGPVLLAAVPRIDGLAAASVVPLIAAAMSLWRHGAETSGRPLLETPELPPHALQSTEPPHAESAAGAATETAAGTSGTEA